jgi:hypothetical protein
MKKLALAVAVFAFALGCSQGEFHPGVSDLYPAGMLGPVADCQYPVLTFRVGGAEQELDINGLPVRTFWGAQLLCQSCDNPANWLVLHRRGVSFADIFAAAGIDVPDSTPVNFIGRDGWDPWRTVLGCNPDRLMTFGYLRDNAYIYVGGAGLKDPSLPVDAPGNFAKDPLYPAMECWSLCLDFNHDSVLGAQAAAYAEGMEVGQVGCFGQYRYSMLEKYSDSACGLIEIDPQM